MDSPVTYILIILLCTAVLLTVVFMLSWYTMGRQKYVLVWALTFAVNTFLWVTHLSSELFDSSVFYLILACFISTFSITLGTWGHCLRAQSTIKVRYYFYTAALVVALTYCFTAIEPHVGLQMSMFLYFDFFSLLTQGIVVLKHRVKSRPAEIGAATAHILFGISLFVAANMALMQGRYHDPYYLEWVTLIRFTAVPIGFVGMSIFVVFMLASDLSEKMKELAMTDVLTDCLNRRGFYDRAQQQLIEFRMRSQHVCLIYWDIDFFKAINDKYGHAGGDTTLIETTKRVREHIKSSDLIGRVGGEEFVILIGRASYDDAINVADRLRELIDELPVIYNGKAINVTASFGVVSIDSESAVIEDAINAADTALYAAKASGRNQVVNAPPLSA